MNNDAVNHPKHYNVGSIEVIDYISDRTVSFSMGNVIKYIARCNYKGNKLEDLKKAKFYLQYCIDNEIESTMCDIDNCDYSWSEFSRELELSGELMGVLEYMDKAMDHGMNCDTRRVEFFLKLALKQLEREIKFTLQEEGK